MSEREIAAEYVGNIARSLTSLMQVTHQERRADLLRAVPLAAGLASPAVADQLTPEHMRAVADGLHDLADEWEQNND